MNAVRPIRMAPERAVTFRAWRDNREVVNCPGLDDAQTFEEAINAVAPGSPHKSAVSVLLDDAARGRRQLNVYQIKKSSKRGHWRAAYDGGRPVFEAEMEGHLVMSIPVDAFEPTRLFDAFRDDPVGCDRTLVEG